MSFKHVQFLVLIISILFLGSTVSCGQSNWRKPDVLFEAMKINEGSWAADIGAGDGDYTVRMAPIVEDSGHIFAVDIDRDKLEELHDQLEDWDTKNVTPVYSVPGDPMLLEKALDALLIRNAYHEFRNYMEMLQHLKASLKSGGRLVMAEPMEQEVVGKGRGEQMKEHSLAMKFARNDLKNAGFQIIKEVEKFTENKYRWYWLIVAEKPN